MFNQESYNIKIGIIGGHDTANLVNDLEKTMVETPFGDIPVQEVKLDCSIRIVYDVMKRR